MNEQKVEESPSPYFSQIEGVAVGAATLNLYRGLLKLKLSEPDSVPFDWLKEVTFVFLNEDDVVLDSCMIRAFDTLGLYYHGYLEPKRVGRSSIPPADITRSARIRIARNGEWRDFKNDRELLLVTGKE